MYEVRCVVDSRSLLGEGCCWDANTDVLWWVDIRGRLICRYDPASGTNASWQLLHRPTCIAPRRDGGLLVALDTGFAFFDPTTGKLTPIVDPEAHQADARLNDGRTDRRARFWCGSMFDPEDRPRQRIGTLYRLDADLSCHAVAGGIGCSNGLAWSPDGRTMYHTDSSTSVVWSWDSDPYSGAIANRRVFVDLSAENAFVDGATVDAAGCYWATLPMKSKVVAFDPSGRRIATVILPVDAPTSCEFGGSALDVLYVTTATLGRDPTALANQPQAGGLFAIHGLGVTGLRSEAFAG